MSTLCKAAWNHIQINAEGTINPCCMFSPTIYLNQYDNLQDAFDGIENQTMRNNMLKNVSIEGCHKCDLYESLNKKSYRSYFNEKYDDSTIGNPKIRELEIALDRVRVERNFLLSQTDFYALSDVTMSSDMENYRQNLRDITNGLDTVEKCNNVTWPTKP